MSETRSAAEYGYDIVFDLGDLTGATGAAVFVSDPDGRAVQKAASLASIDGKTMVQMTVQRGDFRPGMYRLRPAVDFGPDVRRMMDGVEQFYVTW